MWPTIITSVLPLLMKLIGMFFSSKNASADQKAAYKEFIDKMQKSPNTPANLRLSYEEQLKKLNDESASV
jgi:hypothetical protein